MPSPQITAWRRGTPDGYQFILGFTAHHAFHPTLYKTPVYNPRTDFAPVALVVEQPFLLVTRIDFPASNLQEFVAYAKANQAKLQFGSGAGTGSGNHMSCEMLNAAIGVKVSHVPYRDIGPLTQDMIAGRVDYQCPLPGTMIPLIETNKVKGIATLGKGRLAGLPNLASAHEQGLRTSRPRTGTASSCPGAHRNRSSASSTLATIAMLDTPSVQQRLGAIAASVVAPDRRSPEYLQRFCLERDREMGGADQSEWHIDRMKFCGSDANMPIQDRLRENTIVLCGFSGGACRD